MPAEQCAEGPTKTSGYESRHDHQEQFLSESLLEHGCLKANGLPGRLPETPLTCFEYVGTEQEVGQCVGDDASAKRLGLDGDKIVNGPGDQGG
jgi:hypothetical protein